MTEFTYGVIISYEIPDLEIGDADTMIKTPMIDFNDVITINKILHSQFKSCNYRSNSILTLYNATIYGPRDNCNILYVRCVEQIIHPLFIQGDQLQKALHLHNPITTKNIHSEFMNFEFNSSFTGNFVKLDMNDNIVIRAFV